MLPQRSRNTRYLALVGLVSLALAVGLVALQPPPSLAYWVIRVAALLGYLGMFLSVVSAAYLARLVRFFGRPFVKVHHAASITALVAMMVHPLSLAWNAATLSVFVPRFDSFVDFMTYGGRVVWPLAGIAAAAAWLRKPLGARWRVVHYLNYLAFWLVTVHAILIGTQFQSIVVRIVAVAMALATLVVFVQKRLPRRRRPSVRKASR